MQEEEQHLVKVVNVYQEKYTNNKYCTGFGDYIRGCFCLAQYASMNNLEFDMNYTGHYISTFLNKTIPISNQKEGEDDYIVIKHEMVIHPFRVFFHNKNLMHQNTPNQIQQNITKMIKDKPNGFQDQSYLLCINAYPSEPIEQEHVLRVRNALRPNPLFQEKIDHVIKSYGLTKGQYNVIHIRTGDKYILPKSKEKNINPVLIECKRAFLNVFEKGEFSAHTTNESKFPYILISDCNPLKKQLKSMYPNLIIKLYKTSHTGENALNQFDDKQKYEATENTLLDFFLMANSNSVFGFSPECHMHGTGFSEQCCKLYNVPYSHHKILNLKMK